MIIPETIGTIASLLTIIDYTIKFSSYLSSKDRIVLSRSQQKIRDLDPYAPATSAVHIFDQELRNEIPESKISTSAQDISNVFDVLSSMSQILENNEKYFELPSYGAALNQLMNDIRSKFLDWHCFHVYAVQVRENSDEDFDEYGDYILLFAPNLTQAIKKIRPVTNFISNSASNGDVFYNARDVYPLIMTSGKYKTVRDHDFNTKHNELSHARLEFEFKSLKIYDHKKWWDDEGINGGESYYSLSSSDFELIANGLLGDLIYYSKLVRGEIEKSRDALSRIRGFWRR